MTRPVHHVSTARLSPESERVVERLVRCHGRAGAARILHTGAATIERVLGPGVQRATRDRLETRVRELSLCERGDRAKEAS